MMNSVVSVIQCRDYEPNLIKQAIIACLEPLGGMAYFVHPGMHVLLKPNLLTAADPIKAVTTHPNIVKAVAELVHEAGGEVIIGDSPSGPVSNNQAVWRKTGILDAAEKSGSSLVLFDQTVWKRKDNQDYYIAKPIIEADLVINLPKIKTHTLTLYTGSIKNLYGVIPGNRKNEIHLRSPMIQDFSHELVNVLEIVRPGLTIMDGVVGQEGNGPGVSGTPHLYGFLAASVDPVALDTIITRAMGYRGGEVEHLTLAGAKQLGINDFTKIKLQGRPELLTFGKLILPSYKWFMKLPLWVSKPLHGMTRQTPWVDAAACTGCGNCGRNCPAKIITNGKPPRFDLDHCLGCFCCAEVCPQGAITPKVSNLSRLIKWGKTKIDH
jgi:uncharacterized protein (DUF362 family)/ferredoxin